MSEHEYTSIRKTPLSQCGELNARDFLRFLSTCTPRVRACLLDLMSR